MTVSVDGEVLDAPNAKEHLPRDTEARTVIARRHIAERCLYGVDLNPLAVELAKLSIWLVTLAKGRPFGFLDHNLRCGDSLLGIHRLDQLTELSMTPTGKGQQRLFGQSIERVVHEAIELRLRLRKMPIRDIRDVATMARLDGDARRKLEVPERIADALIGLVFASGGSNSFLANNTESLAMNAGQAVVDDLKALELIVQCSVSALSIEKSPDKPARKPFHWALEFPEVILGERLGFDAVVGNPPFLWGKRISTHFGDKYLSYLERGARSALGAADLCVHFLLRSAQVTSSCADIGLVLVDTIAQGDTREVGLGALLSDGNSIVWAKSSMQWPGKATVRISPLVLHKGRWNGQFVLDGQLVKSIDSRLIEQVEEAPPKKLQSQDNISYVGHYPMGQGFILSPEEAKQLISQEPLAKEIIFEYLRGEDVNQRADQRSHLLAINFGIRSLAECESRYPQALDRIRTLVKPDRDRQKRKSNRERWWIYADHRPGLARAIDGCDSVIVQPFTSKYLTFTMVPANMVFASPMVVIVSNAIDKLGVLHSSFHDCWVRKYASRMGESLRYASSDCFETFPFPGMTANIRDASKAFYVGRQRLLAAYGIGVTALLNMVHSQSEKSRDIADLRDLIVALDQAILEAYGWTDIALNHCFDELDGRFSVKQEAKKEILSRLLALNHAISGQCRPVRAIGDASESNLVPRNLRSNNTTGPDLLQPAFDFDALTASTPDGTTPATEIVRFLSTYKGWHAKGDVLAATAISDGQWNAAIADLIANGRVERQGEKRGSRYRMAGSQQ